MLISLEENQIKTLETKMCRIISVNLDLGELDKVKRIGRHGQNAEHDATANFSSNHICRIRLEIFFPICHELGAVHKI